MSATKRIVESHAGSPRGVQARRRERSYHAAAEQPGRGQIPLEACDGNEALGPEFRAPESNGVDAHDLRIRLGDVSQGTELRHMTPGKLANQRQSRSAGCGDGSPVVDLSRETAKRVSQITMQADPAVFDRADEKRSGGRLACAEHVLIVPGRKPHLTANSEPAAAAAPHVVLCTDSRIAEPGGCRRGGSLQERLPVVGVDPLPAQAQI